MSKTIQELQQEYNQETLALGNMVYRVHALRNESEEIKREIRKKKAKLLEINRQADRLQKAEVELPEVKAEEVANEQQA